MKTRPTRSGRHEHTATLLNDRTLLVLGGFPKESVTAAESHFQKASLALVERWAPRGGVWRFTRQGGRSVRAAAELDTERQVEVSQAAAYAAR